MLFLALLVLSTHSSRAELEIWATSVLRQESAFVRAGSGYRLPAEWQSNGGKVAPIFDPLAYAYGHEHSTALLDPVATAMQACAKIDGRLDAEKLKTHRRWQNDKKTKGKQWKTPAALFGVARLVLHRGRELRAALRIDTPREELPTAAEQIAARDRQLAESKRQAAAAQAKLEKQVEAATAWARKSKDAHRKAAGRLQTKIHAVTDARKDERAKVAARSKAERAAATARAREARKRVAAELKEKAEAAAEQKYDTQTVMLKAQVARARARARATEAAAKLSAKRLRRAQSAEARLKELRDAELQAAPE